MFMALKNSYLINILLKNYKLFGSDSYNILNIPENFHSKI